MDTLKPMRVVEFYHMLLRLSRLNAFPAKIFLLS